MAVAPYKFHTTPALNLLAHGAERLIAGYPFVADGVNLGGAQAHGNGWTGFAGDATVTGGVFTSDAGGNYMDLYTNGTAVVTLLAPAVADVVVPRGTFICCFKDFAPNNTAVTNVLGTGRSTATYDGAFGIARAALSNDLNIQLRVAGTTYLLTFTGILDGNWHVLAVEWGPDGGLVAYLDQWAATDGTYRQSAAACTGGWKVEATRKLTINGGVAGGSAGDLGVRCALFFDRRLSRRELEDYLCDPGLAFRPHPDEATHLLNSRAIAGRVTGTSAQFLVTTGSGTLSSANLALRSRVATDRYAVWAATPTDAAVAGATSYSGRQLVTTASGLTAGTRYWHVHEWTPDGTNWYPIPWEMGYLVTQRSSGRCRADIISDPHTGAQAYGTPAESVGQGCGLDLAGTPALWLNLVSWLNQRDLFIDADPPDFVVNLGDWQYHDAGGLANGTNDVAPNMILQCARTMRMHHLALACGGQYAVQGNHEPISGNYQNNGGKAQQKQALIALKRTFPNPTHQTYPEGGENQGAVADNPDWVPPLGGSYDQTYRNTYCVDALGENATPRQTWYAFRWGAALFVALDVYSYTSVPGTTGEAVFSLGAAQRAWLDALLAASDAKWTVILMHSCLRGEDTGYRRGRTRRPGRFNAVELWLHNLLRAKCAPGSVVVLHGHDHTMGSGYIGGVEYWCCPPETGATFVDATTDFYGPAEGYGALMNETQQVRVNATAGTYSLTFTGPDGEPVTIGPFAYDAALSTVTAAMAASGLTGYTTQQSGSSMSDEHGLVVTYYRGAWARKSWPLIVADTSNLTGTVTVTRVTAGGNTGAGLGIIKHLHLQGRLRLEWDEETFEIQVRQTYVNVANIDLLPSFNERQLLHKLTAADGVVTLVDDDGNAETPRVVVGVFPAAAMDAEGAEWWLDETLANQHDDEVPGLNYCEPPAGAYVAEPDPPHTSNQYTADAALPDGDVYALYFPRTAWRHSLTIRPRDDDQGKAFPPPWFARRAAAQRWRGAPRLGR